MTNINTDNNGNIIITLSRVDFDDLANLVYETTTYNGIPTVDDGWIMDVINFAFPTE